MDIKPLQAKGPYPQIDNIIPNTYYGKILVNNFAGKNSEFSAISQYIYQHLVLNNEYKEISKTLKSIAICEMHHLEILGETALLLGIMPKYCYYPGYGMHSQYWNGSFINYNKDIKDMLALNIKGEEKAIAQYYETINVIKDIQIDSIIQRIIEDEELHLKTLNDILVSL